MNKKLLIIFCLSIILLFCGCKSNIVKEKGSNIFNFTGTWRIDSVEQLGEEDDNEEEDTYLVGDKI